MAKIETKQVFCTKNIRSFRLLRDFVREDLNITICESEFVQGKHMLMVPSGAHASVILSGQKFLINNNVLDVNWVNYYKYIRELGYFDMGYMARGNVRSYVTVNPKYSEEMEAFFLNLRKYLNSELKKHYDSADNTFCLSVQGLDYYKMKVMYDEYIMNVDQIPFAEVYDSKLNGQYTKKMKLKSTIK